MFCLFIIYIYLLFINNASKNDPVNIKQKLSIKHEKLNSYDMNFLLKDWKAFIL